MKNILVGRVRPVWKGLYKVDQAYDFFDWVSFNGSSYIVVNESGSPAGTLPDDTVYWACTASKGDVGGSAITGQIISSIIPIDDIGVLPLDGKLLYVGSLYDSFISYIAALRVKYPSAFVSEEQWQETFAEFGSCGKFVYTDGVSLRLPCVSNVVAGTTDFSALGDLVALGLPNIVSEAGSGDKQISATNMIFYIVACETNVSLPGNEVRAILDALCVSGNDGQFLRRDDSKEHGFSYETIYTVPSGGNSGQALVKNSAANGDTKWENIFPLGGSDGQVLKKDGATDGATKWADVDALPKGGVAGQVLTKKSTVRGDSAWEDIKALPENGQDGQVLTVGKDGEATWTDAQLVGKALILGQCLTALFPLKDKRLLLLDGQTIYEGSIYGKFISYLISLKKTNPELFLTEEEWQACVTKYGSCGKFVYAPASTTTTEGTWEENPNPWGDAIYVPGETVSTPGYIRLPKVSNIVEGTTDVSAVGDLVEAGLPNILGSFGANNISEPHGAFRNEGALPNYGTAGNGTNNWKVFDASQYNPIYGKSDTVQPQTIKVLYYIVALSEEEKDTNDYVIQQEPLYGKFIYSSTPLNNKGLHLADGSVLNKADYPGFYNYIAGLQSSVPNLFVSNDGFDYSENNYGMCAKYVITETTVRIPHVARITQPTMGKERAGDLVASGLPNITGSYNAYGVEPGRPASGALWYSTTGSPITGHHSGGALDVPIINFNASRSNAIYGRSTTVQPPTFKSLCYIVVGPVIWESVVVNNVRTETEGLPGQVLTKTNGGYNWQTVNVTDKANTSLANLTAAGLDKIATLSSPGQNYRQLSIPAVGTYSDTRRTDYIQSPGNGWIVVNYNIPAGNGQLLTSYLWDDMWLGTSNTVYCPKGYGVYATIMLPVSKNSKWSWHSTSGNILSVYFTEKNEG